MPPSGFMETDQISETKTVLTNFYTMVKNSLENNEPVSHTEFVITLWNGTKIIRRTNERGILSWADQQTYKTSAPAHLITRTVTFTHSSGFSQTIPLMINPWKKFGFDVRSLQPEEVEKIQLQQINRLNRK